MDDLLLSSSLRTSGSSPRPVEGRRRTCEPRHNRLFESCPELRLAFNRTAVLRRAFISDRGSRHQRQSVSAWLPSGGCRARLLTPGLPIPELATGIRSPKGRVGGARSFAAMESLTEPAGPLLRVSLRDG